MIEFFYNLGENLENFFKTPLAALMGTVFIVIVTALILFLIRYFEKN